MATPKFKAIQSLGFPAFSARNINAEVTAVGTSWTTITDSDVVIRPDVFKMYGKLYASLFVQLKNSVGLGAKTYARLYRRYADTAFTASVFTESTIYLGLWSNWEDISSDSILESYQLQMKVDNWIGYCNSASIIITGFLTSL